MFSITTIASSTTSPVASVMPNSVSVLIEKPNSFTNANVPIERHRNRDRRNQRRPPVLEEQEHHQDDEADRLEQRRDDLANRLGRRRVVVSNATSTFSPGGKRFDSRSISASTSR